MFAVPLVTSLAVDLIYTHVQVVRGLEAIMAKV
jgi:hypothetical protein